MIVSYEEFLKKIEDDSGYGADKAALESMKHRIKIGEWFTPTPIDVLHNRVPYFIYADGTIIPYFMDPDVAKLPLAYFQVGGPPQEFYAYPLSDFVLKYGS